MHYTVIILSLERFKSKFESLFPRIANELSINQSVYEIEKENSYDWIVTNAILNCLQGRTTARVYNHFRHDLYKCIYDHFENELVFDFSMQFNKTNVNFENTDTIKVMVTGQSVFIAKGYLYE